MSDEIIDPVTDDTIVSDESLSAPLTVTTDQGDYAPGSTAIITATNVEEGGSVTFEVDHVIDGAVVDDGISNTGISWTVQDGSEEDGDSEANGTVVTTWDVGQDALNQAFIVTATDSTGETATASFTDGNPNPKLNPNSWADGPAPDAVSGTSTDEWQNGDLNASKSHYAEGDFIPFRAVYSGLTVGETYTITLTYDTLKNGKHAFDYLGSYDYSLPNGPNHSGETTPDPLIGTGLSGAPALFAIPDDPNQTVIQIPGNFSLWGGTPLTLGAYTTDVSQNGDTTDTKLTLTFTASGTTAVLGYGAHIASEADWGAGNAAIDIKGSPYHVATSDDPTKQGSDLQFQFGTENGGGGGGGGGGEGTASLTIDKTTQDMADPNGTAADGITVLSDEDIRWVYLVTNTGTLDLNNVTVTDDNGTAATADDQIIHIGNLAAGESTTVYLNGTATAGAYSNSAFASGHVIGSGDTVNSDADTSNYLGLNPHLTLDKVTADLGDDDVVDGTPGDGKTILKGENIQWQYTVTNDGNVDLTNIVVVDDNGTAATGDDVTVGTIASLLAGASTTLTLDGVAGAGPYTNNATATADAITDDAGHSRAASDSDNSSYTGLNPHLTLDKVTADLGDDTVVDGTPGDGNTILKGENIQWQYKVTNDGNVDLTNIVVIDDNGTAATGDDVTVGTIASLLAGASATLTLDGVAGAGAYANNATATADAVTDSAGHSSTASDTDGSSYTGLNPHLTLDKVTADLGDDAVVDGTAGDGNTILKGENIQWQYTVTNDGNVDLTNIVVVDDGGDGIYGNGNDIAVGTIASLLAGASTTLTYNSVAVAGAYANDAKATADATTDTAGHSSTASDTDGSSYFGANPKIDIDKVTTGLDVSAVSHTGDSISILAGTGVTWTYTVTNTGNEALSNVVVSDDKLGTLHLSGDTDNDGVLDVTESWVANGDANNDGKLDLTETWIYTATGTAGVGAYSNTGTATGDFTDTAGHKGTATDSDGSSYNGSPFVAGGALSQGFWSSHADAWDNIANNEGNATKSAFASHVLSALDVNPSSGTHSTDLLLGDSNHNGVADDAHDLWISISAAKGVLAASSSGDARVIMLTQAIATQLNIDNGIAQPDNIIDEALMWLTKQGAWSGVGVDVGIAVPVSNGAGGLVSTVKENAGHTGLAGSSVATSGAAWKTYVDVQQNDVSSAANANGEGLKNALMWWNDGHLVTSTPGGFFVAWDNDATGAGAPAFINLNTSDEFWDTLHSAEAAAAGDQFVGIL